MSRQIFSITQVNEYIQNAVENDPLLMGLAVCGEISNYKLYPSGHHYFTLKDENASLKCVMFRSSAVRLRFKPENGMKIIAMGKISVYPRDGVYQLYCSALVQDGVGDLHVAFEQMKKKLSAEGLFDPAHKKSIPVMPGKICIITSPAGAAVHDMIRIIHSRFPLSEVVLLPVRVQGAEAPQEIADGIHLANALNLADVLIVGRGGGSIEDLWAFNDERVARAIFASKIPVISAVGHEPDVTISDYVADLRAATPSNAAELVVPDQNALRLSLDKQQQILLQTISQRIRTAKQHLNMLCTSKALREPDAYIQVKRDLLARYNERLAASQAQQIAGKKEKFIQIASKLDAMSPLKVLQRGYSVVKGEDNHLIRSVLSIKIGDKICLTVTDGTIYSTVDSVVEAQQ